MKHRFKGKKRIKKSIFKTFFIIAIVIISFLFTFDALFKQINVSMDKDKYLSFLVHDSFGKFKIIDVASLNSMDFLLKYSLGIEKDYNNDDTHETIDEIKDIPVTTEEKKEEKVEVQASPIIYIYNTHQTEGYKSNGLETFNIENNVLFASHILKEYLSDLGLPTIVEEESIPSLLHVNNWKYGYSYKASRILLENAYKNNSSLEYFIDLHRDSAGHNVTTVEIGGISYAKVMFVIGLENEGYPKNLKLVETLNELLKSESPGITRGVIKKQGKGVNGVYNQDFNENCFLIEVGGVENSIEEVNNTLKILAKVIFSYINEVKYGT